jgi:hypothetical protein
VRFLDQPPPFLLFTGKGGVGKTSVAAAGRALLEEDLRSALYRRDRSLPGLLTPRRRCRP